MTSINSILKLLLKLLASLPFNPLYLQAFIMNSVVNYRKKVVFQNIRNYFFVKNEEEILKKVAQFYRNLADLNVDLALSNIDLKITNNYICLLEKSNINQPYNRLCSHRRWKFIKEERIS